MTETATVETLTAEVRVLMVGNRQITLSVFHQLDRCPAEDVKPFGRVRVTKDLPRDVVEIVGAAPDGNLVRANVSRPTTTFRGMDIPSEVEHHIAHSAGLKRDQTIATSPKGRRLIYISNTSTSPCSVDWGCDLTKAAAAFEKWSVDWVDDLDQEMDLYETSSALPLIVLAGLR